MVLRRFAEFAVAERDRGLSPEVQQAANRAVVDWFSATVAGSGMDAARIMRATLLDGEGAEGPCRLVPGGERTSARTAALINATASHIAEMDDIFREGIYHPGSPTVGAVLAAAELTGASGADLLRAVAVGYEIGDRIAEAMQPAHYTYWHTTGTVGTIGAAAGVAELLRLDVEQFAHALATATTMAAGLQQAFRSDAMSKPLHAGHAAEQGLLAAQLAARGFTGALDVLDGEAGFGAAMGKAPDWDAAVAALGAPWGVTNATVKNHSCCGHTFAAVDAALALRNRGVSAEDVREIRVATYTTATKVAGNPDPRTAFEAKFSTAYCVAAALALGSVRLRAFEEERLSDPLLRNLVKRTTVEADSQYDAAFPGQRAARVTVVDGSGTEHEYVRTTRKGDPDDPLTDAELREKFDDLTVPVLGAGGSADLAHALWGLPDLDDVRRLAGMGSR
jgi:2-methylcitrate dehydratase PrpD